MKSLRREYPLSTLLELIGMPRSTYYYHEANPPSDRQATERPAIVEICEKSQFRYGYRRVADTLRKATGVRIADKTVLKVMREEGLLCRTRRRRKYRSYMGQVGKSSPNLLARDFEAEGPMTKLVTDVTEFKVGGTKLYLSPVVDLYNDEVVAYSISRSPNMKMVLEMLAGLEGRLDGEDAKPRGQCAQGRVRAQARARSQHRPSKGNAPLSAGKPSRCLFRLFDSARARNWGGLDQLSPLMVSSSSAM